LILITLTNPFDARLHDEMTVRRATFAYMLLRLNYSLLLIPIIWLPDPRS